MIAYGLVKITLRLQARLPARRRGRMESVFHSMDVGMFEAWHAGC